MSKVQYVNDYSFPLLVMESICPVMIIFIGNRDSDKEKEILEIINQSKREGKNVPILFLAEVERKEEAMGKVIKLNPGMTNFAGINILPTVVLFKDRAVVKKVEVEKESEVTSIITEIIEEVLS